ncbi:MAG TPA: hypothetical protein VFM46_08020, partial [Pseudomonadales bacterium]|nr:hypothetical protein [Pseudomonadales bacterium]
MLEVWLSQLSSLPLPTETLRWLAIPLVAAIAGLLANWLAVMLLFHPRDYFGIKPLGWQGLIPARSRHIARIMAHNIIHTIGDVETLYARLEPEQITKHLARSIRPHLDTHLDEIMLHHNPVYWENLPVFFKNRFYSHAHRQLELALDDLIEAVGDNVHRLWNLEAMLEQVLLQNKSVLIKLFHEVGDEHFSFLVRAGFGAGFICGLFCMFVQLLFPNWWWAICMLGMISGAVCNWLVIQWIFGPVPAVKFGPFKLQSRFVRSQTLLAEKFADTAAYELITAAHVFDHLLHGPQQKLMRNLIHKHVATIVDAAHIKAFAQLSLGLGKFVDIKQAMTLKSHELIHHAAQ